MSQAHRRRRPSLATLYPPSPACSCDICVGYCARPGWWTVAEAEAAIRAGYGGRMMLEVAPERTFGVLSPAFKGCEEGFALEDFSSHGCTFLVHGLCALFGTGHQPLECRFCHHDRPGQGPACHAAIERDWNTAAGRALVRCWCKLTGLGRGRHLPGLEWLK